MILVLTNLGKERNIVDGDIEMIEEETKEVEQEKEVSKGFKEAIKNSFLYNMDRCPTLATIVPNTPPQLLLKVSCLFYYIPVVNLCGTAFQAIKRKKCDKITISSLQFYSFHSYKEGEI